MNFAQMHKERQIKNQIKRRILQGKDKFLFIPLPSPQMTGTETQKVTYAEMEAQRLFDKYELRKLVYS